MGKRIALRHMNDYWQRSTCNTIITIARSICKSLRIIFMKIWQSPTMSVIYRAYAHEGVLLIFARREEALAIYGSITVAEIVNEKSGDARMTGRAPQKPFSTHRTTLRKRTYLAFSYLYYIRNSKRNTDDFTPVKPNRIIKPNKPNAR